jgi:Ca2+/Na+ antiporter
MNVRFKIKWVKRTSVTGGRGDVDLNQFDLNPLNKANYALFLGDMPDWRGDPASGGGMRAMAKWIYLLPTKILFYFTMPDVRVEKYKRLYMVTFGLSIFWLAILSYLIVWMITIIGHTLGMPDSLMAVTFIAAGTSIPDAYTSVVVVREGMVDMGVSNIIGSNVFDLLIGLALPWFVRSIFGGGGFVIINSNGLLYDSLLLYACVFVTVSLLEHFFLPRFYH